MLLFWGFHNIMSGISAMMLNILGAHIGVTFSSGMIDLIVYGMVPASEGTHFYWAFVVGVAFIPIYFSVFYITIKKFNIPTPGREGTTLELKTKNDYKNKKTKNNKFTLSVIEALGGKNNISNIEACATRLRVDVVNSELVNEKRLKELGAMGNIWTTKNHIQSIFGGKAEVIANQMKNLK